MAHPDNPDVLTLDADARARNTVKIEQDSARMKVAERLSAASIWSPDTAWSVLLILDDDETMAAKVLDEAARRGASQRELMYAVRAIGK